MKIEARKGKDGTPVEFDYPIYDTVEENIKAYGADIVNSRFRAALVVDVQNIARNLLGKGKTHDEIRTELGKWKPGLKAVGKTKFEKAIEGISSFTPEQLAALLAAVQSQQKGGSAAPKPAAAPAGAKAGKSA